MAIRLFNHRQLTQTVVTTNPSHSYEEPISACGCLFYRICDGRKQLLLIKYYHPKWPRLDDLGGKAEIYDHSVEETMYREVGEESNQVINRQRFALLLANTSQLHFYNKSRRYYLTAVQVDEQFCPDTSVFGNWEYHAKFARTLHWVDAQECIPHLSGRLVGMPGLIKWLRRGELRSPLNPPGIN